MEYKFQYFSEEERLKILNDNSDKFLILVQEISEGNFLTFTDIKPIEVVISELEEKAIVQEQAIADLTIYMATLGF